MCRTAITLSNRNHRNKRTSQLNIICCGKILQFWSIWSTVNNFRICYLMLNKGFKYHTKEQLIAGEEAQKPISTVRVKGKRLQHWVKRVTHFYSNYIS